MAVIGIGPDFPKCPGCKLPMKSAELKDVPARARQEMIRYNRYQPLNPAYWYHCEEGCDVYLHKLAVNAK